MSIRDELVRCPFDENHRVSRARFPVHLIKCRKQHKNMDFSICPFNATHYILTPEFQFHLDNCPDRKERELAAALNEQPSAHVKDIVVPPPSEIWGDDGEEVVSYLEVKDQLIAKLPILRAPTGMTKSERKRFMRQEIHRFHNLDKNQASNSRGANNDFDWEPEEEQPVREEEEEKNHSDNDQASGKEAQGYEAEDDDHQAVNGKQENGGQFSVVKRKKNKNNSLKQEVEDKGGKSPSDKKNNQRRKQ